MRILERFFFKIIFHWRGDWVYNYYQVPRFFKHRLLRFLQKTLSYQIEWFSTFLAFSVCSNLQATPSANAFHRFQKHKLCNMFISLMQVFLRTRMFTLTYPEWLEISYLVGKLESQHKTETRSANPKNCRCFKNYSLSRIDLEWSCVIDIHQ
jgi:hypothetical protein